MPLRHKYQGPLQGLLLSLTGLWSFGCSPSAELLVNEQNAESHGETASASKPLMPDELRAAYIATKQAEGGEHYRAGHHADGAATFVHAAQRFHARLDGVELRLAPMAEQSWNLSLRTVGLGCANHPVPTLDAGVVTALSNRVDIQRENVHEWYVNGPLGLEQGFMLQQAPGCSGTKVVAIDVAGSLTPKLEDHDGDGKTKALAFVDATGAAVARYTDLYVKDTTGKHLPAWMDVADGRITLHIDDAGAAYPLEIDPLVTIQEIKLIAADGATGDELGTAASLSGDTALVGAWRDTIGTNTDQGSAYVFVRNGSAWTQQAKLTASDGALGDQFGTSVSVSGDTAIVGAYNDDDKGMNSGSAYIFVKPVTGWATTSAFHAKLTASDGAAGNQFGSTVSLSGDTALVGAYNDDDKGPSSGSAYIFVKPVSGWATTSTYNAKLTASDGAAGDLFGTSISLSGDMALIGACNDDDKGMDSGSAYIFVKPMTGWATTSTFAAKLTAGDGAMGDQFGTSVSLSGDTALVGAWQHDVGANSNQGAAYVFVRNGMLWTEQQQLTAIGGTGSDYLGSAVALSGDIAVVASSDGNQGQGFVKCVLSHGYDVDPATKAYCQRRCDGRLFWRFGRVRCEYRPRGSGPLRLWRKCSTRFGICVHSRVGRRRLCKLGRVCDGFLRRWRLLRQRLRRRHRRRLPGMQHGGWRTGEWDLCSGRGKHRMPRSRSWRLRRRRNVRWQIEYVSRGRSGRSSHRMPRSHSWRLRRRRNV